MKDKLNVAIVGCGGMAAHYLAVYRDLPFVRVVCCVEPNRENARRAADVFQAHEPAIAGDFNSALAPAMDAVIINTPNSLHHEQAVAAIRAGKHVLLQKPVAPTLEEAREIARAAAASDRTVGLYMSYFDQPAIHDLHDMIAQGRLGSVVHCYARLMHKGGMMWSEEALRGERTWRGSVAETGGGCFIQLAVHYIHIFEWASGARVRRATAFMRNLHCPGLEGEDLAVALLELDSGAMITLDTAWCAHGEELAVFGTLGRFEYRNNRWLALASTSGAFEGRVVRYSPGPAQAQVFGGPQGEEQQMEIVPPAFGDAANPLNQHRTFLEAARAGRPAPVSIAAGVRDMEVVAAVYESARTGRAVDVA
ncbi:MAG TPA: Gfo/Idh/MocA family oxidoreductase [Bryobacteraceae bacterium]|nr:Gfo/Idh/MocA family oxidoreductase [Bryobacteraceae bacterium]